MSKEILMQFMGFESKDAVREYTFQVREPAMEPREFTITITHVAFNERRVRFQDAPDVCALKLRRELTTYGNHPPQSHFDISDAELDDYRNSHASPKRSMFHRRPTEEY
jgi:hypothetical protein